LQPLLPLSLIDQKIILTIPSQNFCFSNFTQSSRSSFESLVAKATDSTRLTPQKLIKSIELTVAKSIDQEVPQEMTLIVIDPSSFLLCFNHAVE
jgi:hypothetical protein